MFVECLYLLNWYSVEFSVETNRTVEIAESCRICILIGECWNGVDSLKMLELVELPGKAGWS